jgi:hypothetical protein
MGCLITRKTNFDWEILGFRHGAFAAFWDVKQRDIIEAENPQHFYYPAAKYLLNNEVKLVVFGRYTSASRPRTGLVCVFFSPFNQLTDVHETVPRRLFSTFFTLIFTNRPNIRQCMLRVTDSVMLFIRYKLFAWSLRYVKLQTASAKLCSCTHF